MKTSCKITDPFPVERLSKIDLGSMDGHRDSLIEDSFVSTRSIEKFLLDKHSIIIGPFGSGKSALFHLLRTNSDILKPYKDHFIVTIDEQLQFNELRTTSDTHFPNLSEKLTYQLLWKFQVCRRISEEISKLTNFPANDDEKYVNEFLNRSGGTGGNLSVTERIRILFSNISLKLTAKLSEVPVEVEIAKEAKKATVRVDINLDKVVQRFSKIIIDRKLHQCIVIIDKLDKFVAGEEYETQKSYIEALIQLEDDMFGIEEIGFKIFLRSDLYDRLDFSALGPDKAEDNTLRLSWNKEEIRAFVARRLYISLVNIEVWNIDEILSSSNMSEHHPRWYEMYLLDQNKGSFKFKIANIYINLFGQRKKRSTFIEAIDRIIIEKLFSKKLVHECPDQEEKEISNIDFFDTHFLDGNDSCTPRYILVFLKELLDDTSYYYANTPKVEVVPTLESGSWVYNLFDESLVYESYKKAKGNYIRHITKVDDKWTGHMLEFVEAQRGKQIFDYKWFKKSITIPGDNEIERTTFLIYLEVIGFLKIKKYSPDVKKRVYELPILYKKEKGVVNLD